MPLAALVLSLVLVAVIPSALSKLRSEDLLRNLNAAAPKLLPNGIETPI